MVVTVVVTGVPRFMSLENLAVEFNNVLGDMDLGNFYIRDIAISSKTMLKRQVALDFESSFDAMMVQEKFDGFKFKTSDKSYNVTKAKIQPASCTKAVISTTSRNYHYEPYYGENINEALDVQIDLLKKQTVALKAHRKYIREQKKLKKEFSKLDGESDTEPSRTSKSRKRLRSADSGSSDSVNRSKSRDNYRSPKSWERHKRSRSKSCENYLTIKYKKISTTHRSKSREARTRVRSKSPEKPSRIPESYKERSRSLSCENRNAAYCAIDYRESTPNRKSNSPEPGTSSHRVVRSKSRGNHMSPSRIIGNHRRRSRSPNCKKYYSVETIEYKKELLTKTNPLKSRSKYESRDHVFRSTSSKRRRSQSPYKGDLRLSIDSRKCKTTRSRSPSNFMKSADVNSSSKLYRNRSPFTENVFTKSYKKSRPKYNNDACFKSECNSSKPLDGQRNITKATRNRKSPDRDDQIKIDADIQVKKMQAMEDVLFEMELLLRQERNTVSNADKIFFTDLVKSVVKSRFQKLQVHDCVMAKDVFTRYRRQYSKEDDIALLRNLAFECKSLDEVTSTVVAAEVADLQSKNDEIWTVIDEVLDGVDIDLLQAEPETNEVEVSENPKRGSQVFDEVETVNVTHTNLPDYNKITQINSLSETDANEINTKCVSDGPKNPNITLNKAINKKDNFVDLPSDTMKKKVNITSSDIALLNPKASNSINNLAIDLTAADSKVNVLNTKCNIALVPTKTHAYGNNLQNIVKIESIELSDDSDGDMDNIKRINITSATNQEHIANFNTISISRFSEVVSLAHIEKHEQNILTSIKKENIPTVDLTDDTDEIKITNLASSATHLLKPIKQEIVTDMTEDQSNVALPPANLLSYINQGNIDFYNDKTGTHNDEPDVSIFYSDVVRSNKKEKVATDTHMKHDKCGILSKPCILSTIQQEPGTASLDHPDKPKINNKKTKDTILETIKIEKETTVASEFTNCASETEIEKDKTITTNPVNSANIFNCIERDVAITDDVSQTEVTDINNDQITMPVPMILSSIKNEDVATVNSISLSPSNITDINNGHINMPGPIKSISTKPENDAYNNNSSQITMPVLLVSSVKNKDKRIVKSDSPSQTDVMDVNNDVQIKNSIQMKSNCTIQKYVASRNDFIRQSGISDNDNYEISMVLPIVRSVKNKYITTVNSNTRHENETKVNSIKHIEHGDKSIKHKQERLSSIELENNIKHKEGKDSCIKLNKELDGSIKSKEKRDSSIKQKYIETFKGGSTNLKDIKTSGDSLKKSEPVIRKSSSIKDNKEKSNTNKQNLPIDKVLPRNPRFVLPTYVIMRHLKALIIKTFNENDYMLNITRKVLQDRFKELVKDKGYVNAKNIIKMYKDFYAEEKYTDFLSGIVAGIKAGKYDDEIRKIAIRRRNLEKKKKRTRYFKGKSEDYLPQNINND